jgi:hypothetical protein
MRARHAPYLPHEPIRSHLQEKSAKGLGIYLRLHLFFVCAFLKEKCAPQHAGDGFLFQAAEAHRSGTFTSHWLFLQTLLLFPFDALWALPPCKKQGNKAQTK